MTTILVILLAAAIAFGLAKVLRQPSIPLLIACGLVLGGMLRIVPLHAGDSHQSLDLALVDEVLMLGLMFLVFAAGLELNPARVMSRRRAAFFIGIAQFATLLIIGTAISMVFGLTKIAALHLGLAMAASSTIVIVRILQRRRQFFEPFGRLVLGVLLLQDILIIIAIATLAGAEDGSSGIARAIAATLALGMLTYACARWIAPLLIIRLELDQDSLLLVALALLFGFAGLAHAMHLPPIIGCFLAGVSLSGFPVNGVIRGQLQSLNQFFLAVFFVCLGAVLVIPTTQQLLLAITMVAIILLVTPILVVLVAERFGVSTRAAIETGLLLAQSSELSIIVAVIGVARGSLEVEMLSVISLVAIATMTLTSFIATDRMTWRILRLRPAPARSELDPSLRDHIVMLGCGSNSQVLLDLLLLEGHRVVVADEDPVVISKLHARGVDTVRGDGADPSVLESLHAAHARVIISTMRRIEDNERLIARARGPVVLVRIFGESEATRIERAGGIAIREDVAAATDFFAWFRTRFEPASDPARDPISTVS
jgi:CPA2 family monovalent cation:H+ antiporter-2